MSRILVKSTDGQADPVPFLRGILTRSLQDAGLSFEDSYRVASEVRDLLGDDMEVTTDELRSRVIEQLADFGPEIAQRYERPIPVEPILVRHADGSDTAFSRGRHRLRLEACGISADDAMQLAGSIHSELTAQGAVDVPADQLRALTRSHIVEELGEKVAGRFVTMEEFRDTGRPLLILIGGVAGVGKSTFGSEVAHVLEVLLTLPTDMLRELMRMLIPARLMPVLHTSSFLAWQQLPGSDAPTATHEDLLVRGYMSQAEPVARACEAVVQRALRERVHLILEGIHVSPSLVPQLPEDSDALVVPVLLAVLRPAQLRRRLRGRGRSAPDRRAQRYLDHFDDIWRIQSFLLSEADRTGVPIVTNDGKDRTRQAILGHVVDAIEGS